MALAGDYFSDIANFEPHIITVNAGEDIAKEIVSFAQQCPRAVLIVAANGVISSATLREPNSTKGMVTYDEEQYEIVSLTGSFMPFDESGETSNKSGVMSVQLASHRDNHVVGGEVAGLLIAASHVQIVVGISMEGNQQEQEQEQEQKPKKLKTKDILARLFLEQTSSVGVQEN